MGSMMADLKGVHAGINMILKSNNQPELSIDDLLVMLFDEVEYVWPKLGYPPQMCIRDSSSKSIYCMVKTPIKQCGLLPNHSMMPEYKPTCLTGD